jgi:hypothetical protein
MGCFDFGHVCFLIVDVILFRQVAIFHVFFSVLFFCRVGEIFSCPFLVFFRKDQRTQLAHVLHMLDWWCWMHDCLVIVFSSNVVLVVVCCGCCCLTHGLDEVWDWVWVLWLFMCEACKDLFFCVC